MKKNVPLIFTMLVSFFHFEGKAQATLPYLSGFDNAAQQSGWTEYKKAATTFSHWGYASFDAYSAPNCIAHDYSPSSGINITDNWFVSPAFAIPFGGKLDSIRYKFSGFSQPAVGDTIAIYLLNGSQDPALATGKVLLFDFRGSEYVTDNTYRVKTNLNLSAASGSSYIAIRYRNSDCSSNWLTVNFDNVAISSNSGVGTINIEEQSKQTIFYPNPCNGKLTVQSKSDINRLEIYNVLGEIIYTSIPEKTCSELDFSKYATGSYYIKVENDRNTQIEKIVYRD